MKKSFLGVALFALTAIGSAETVNFDSDTPDQPPSGWLCGNNGKGIQHWLVEADASTSSRHNVLKYKDPATFAWCIRSGGAPVDGTVSVKFKPVAGNEVATGGLIWRWKNSSNYYFAHANAIDGSVTVFSIQNGSQKIIQGAAAPLAPNLWHTIEVTYKGSSIQVSVNGKMYIDTSDTQIKEAGRIGIWTQANSIALFDDFGYRHIAQLTAPSQ